MDVVGSRLIPALEHFWNSWASALKDVQSEVTLGDLFREM